MGAQQTKSSIKSLSKPKTKRFRLRKLRKNNSDSLFTTNSTLTLDKCESLTNIESKSPSCVDLYQDVYLEVDEGPEDFIRSYKELKNKVINWKGTCIECHNIKHMLEEFLHELDACSVWELKKTLIEKTNRLMATLDERYQSDNPRENRENADDNVDIPGNEQIRKMFESFVSFSCRLEKIKVRMIEYYGDDQNEEFRVILGDLQCVLEDIKRVKDKGDIRVVVTREEYEDYVAALKVKFVRLVEINKRQKRTSIFSGGTARSSRTRRSNTNITFASN